MLELKQDETTTYLDIICAMLLIKSPITYLDVAKNIVDFTAENSRLYFVDNEQGENEFIELIDFCDKTIALKNDIDSLIPGEVITVREWLSCHVSNQIIEFLNKKNKIGCKLTNVLENLENKRSSRVIRTKKIRTKI